jgi:hypothetical protein
MSYARMERWVWMRVQWWKAKRAMGEVLASVIDHPVTWITVGALWVAAVAYLQAQSGSGL